LWAWRLDRDRHGDPSGDDQARWVEWSLYPGRSCSRQFRSWRSSLIGFWFQFGFSSRVLVCVLIALFPIITNTLFGLKSTDQAQHDLFTLQRANRFNAC
jgi:NitT/TauT family transport system permease protein